MRQPDTMGNVTDARTVHTRLLERWNAGELNRGHFYAIQKILEQPIKSDKIWEIFCSLLYESEPKQTVWKETETLDPAKVYELFTLKLETREINVMHLYIIAEILKMEIGSPELLAILREFKPKRHERVRITTQPITSRPDYASDRQVEEDFFNSEPPEEMGPENMPFWEISGKVKTAITAFLAALAIGGIGLKMCGESDGNDTPGIETKDPKPETGEAVPDGTNEGPKGEKTESTTINPDNMGFTQTEVQRLVQYGRYYSRPLDNIPDSELQRTLRHRFSDHEVLLAQLFGGQEPDSEETKNLKKLLESNGRPMFIDIGPGLGNPDYPGVTGKEIAEQHPDMPAILLDLPEAVQAFQHMRPARRQELLENGNIHIVSGNGLKSLKEQLEDEATNPFPGRERPRLQTGQPIIIRAANSIDIYCEWQESKRAVAGIAKDFAGHPVLLLWNREIIFKPAGGVTWTIVGQVSPAGFNHRTGTFDRQGEPAFRLSAKHIKRLFAQSEMPSTTEAMGLFFSDNFKIGKLRRENKRMGKRNDQYARAYRELQQAAEEASGTREQWHERLAARMPSEIDLDARAPIWGNRSDIRIPSKRDLPKNHEDALDIFFTNMRRNGDRQIGPELQAHSGGIVVAARGDWQGGKGEKSYRGGGLSPKAGNGVIIYNPNSSEYFYYAHMYEVTVRTGDIIEAGQIIGRGGNTGTKAMEQGRGGHVHFEIHKANPLTGNTTAESSRKLHAKMERNLSSG